MRILGIAGSLRSGSVNRELLHLAGTLLPIGVELSEWEGLRSVPAFDEDRESDAPVAVEELRAEVRDADAVLIVTPEYNGSIPGALKNALDWASRPIAANAFRGKPVAVIGASPGAFGAVWAQAETRKVLGLMGARVVPAELAVGHASARLAEPDAELLGQLREAVALLVAEARPQAAVA
jgi:chromate reductase, NAD(P)H dehydrogenase (quinone)